MPKNTEKIFEDISKKLNVLISLNLRNLIGNKDFTDNKKRKQGVGDLVNYFATLSLEAKDIAEILNTPLQSVRTLLTPKRRKK